jgi:hypothetical protein
MITYKVLHCDALVLKDLRLNVGPYSNMQQDWAKSKVGTILPRAQISFDIFLWIYKRPNTINLKIIIMVS